jgi:hypothetical protein
MYCRSVKLGNKGEGVILSSAFFQSQRVLKFDAGFLQGINPRVVWLQNYSLYLISESSSVGRFAIR